MRALLLFAATAYCAFAALRRPRFGLLAYICYTMMAPYSLTWGLARTFPHTALIGACTLAGFLLSSEAKKLSRQREFMFLLAMWGIFGISTLFAMYPEQAFERLILLSKVLLMVTLSTFLLTTKDHLHLLLRVIALSLGFYGLKVGLFVVMTGGQGAVFGPEDSFLYANNTLGMALAMNVPLLFHLSKIESRFWLRLLMKAMVLFSYPAVIGTFSRGAWLALAAVTELYALKTKYKMISGLIVAALVFSAPIWAPTVLSNQLANRYDSLQNYEEDASAQSRFWNWEFCARVGLGRPFTGGGFLFYGQEAYERFFPEFLQRWPGKVWTCHNMWLTLWAEHGIPGFLIWISLMVSCLISLRRVRSRAKANADLAWALPFTDMIQSAFIGYMIAGTFVDNAYFELYYFLVVATIILKDVTAQPSLRKVPSEPLVVMKRLEFAATSRK